MLIACWCVPDSRRSLRYMLILFRFIDTRLFACARHLASSYAFVGLISNNPGFICPNPRAWTVAGFPVKDQPIRVRSESMADQRQIICIPFLSGPL